ncbi:MAG: hypothetical protein V3575_01225 [Candidatus Absconditabacteria bacterium]
MEITAFNGEKYDRTKSWYIIFGCFYIFMIIIFLFFDNLIGVIFFFFIGGGYLLFSLIGEKNIKIGIRNEGLKIDNVIHPWSKVQGFALEMNYEGTEIKNIVFLIGNNVIIHTLLSSKDLEEFVVLLANNYNIPMVSEFEQTFMEKLVRKLKL